MPVSGGFSVVIRSCFTARFSCTRKESRRYGRIGARSGRRERPAAFQGVIPLWALVFGLQGLLPRMAVFVPRTPLFLPRRPPWAFTACRECIVLAARSGFCRESFFPANGHARLAIHGNVACRGNGDLSVLGI
jgi:hypothetical protein